MPKHLTKKAIAKLLNIPSSSVSYYLENYKEFVVESRLEGQRHPVYSSETTNLVRDIRKMTKMTMSRDEIKEKLLENYPINQNSDSQKQEVTTRDQQQTHKLLKTTHPQQLLEVLNYQETITNSAITSLERCTFLLKEKDQTIQQLEEKIEQLKNDNSELTSENQKLKKRGIWRGLFGSQPE